MSSNKFLQKIWNLNNIIALRNEKKINKDFDIKFNLEISKMIQKIDTSINEFKFNVSIALFMVL